MFETILVALVGTVFSFQGTEYTTVKAIEDGENIILFTGDVTFFVSEGDTMMLDSTFMEVDAQDPDYNYLNK